MQDYSGTPLEPNEAWTIFDRWKSSGQKIGIIFWGRTANVYAMGILQNTRNGRIEFTANGTRSTFNLNGATFKYGPMQTWPKWPSPPVVEVLALRAEFEHGEYLALAEGLMPSAMPLPSLPE